MAKIVKKLKTETQLAQKIQPKTSVCGGSPGEGREGVCNRQDLLNRWMLSLEWMAEKPISQVFPTRWEVNSQSPLKPNNFCLSAVMLQIM